MNVEASPLTTVSPVDLEVSTGSSQEAADLFYYTEFFGNSSSSSASEDVSDLEPGTPQDCPLDSFTSPMETPLQDFDPSPFDESPYSDFLTTPVMADVDPEMMTSPQLEYGMSLFGGVLAEAEEPKSLPLDQMFTMSPMTPSLDFVNPASLDASPVIPNEVNSFARPVPRRKSYATGTRRNLTVDAMVPLDAPTQARTYLYPSATSRKEVPAIIAKKRARSQALGDDDDEFREALPPPSASEQELIAWKRRQNTLAARKSRQRKLLHTQELEKQVEQQVRESEKWRVRTEMMQQLLSAHGIPVPEFAD